MKLKREPIILAVIIIALIIYLVLRSNDRTNYELPEIAKVQASEISLIEISGPSGKLSLKKVNDKWIIGQENYLADAGKIQPMIDVIERPVITAMVSESKNYDRYGLGQDKKIMVKAFSGEKAIREFEIGSTSENKQQTFIRLGDDYRVYHSLKNVRAVFEKKLDDLRDKKVLSFDEEEITHMIVNKGDQTVQLALKELPAENGSDKKTSGSDKSGAIWQYADGRNADKNSIQGLLTTLAGLSCKEYLYNKAKEAFTDPLSKINLSGKKEYTLSIYKKEDNSGFYPAMSSENDCPFLLKSVDADKILDAVDKMSAKAKGDNN
jgi:hypothetical protein